MPSWFFSIITIIFGIVCILSSYFEWTWFWRLGGVGDLIYKKMGHSSMRMLYAFLGTGLIIVVIKDWFDVLLPDVISQLCFAGMMAGIVGLVLFILYRDFFRVKNKKNKIYADSTDNPESSN